MSHFTTIQTQVRDLDALADACRELGVELTTGAARGYNGNTRTGEAVIKLKGPYDIAVNKTADGNYGLTTDWWNGHVEREVGRDYGKLLQLYGVYKASREARKRGYTVRRQSLKDGSIKLAIGGV
jgi:hypothetical protein